ncbi:hypothetical protein [Cytobacillus purgationiresistens]|uniref:Uncharacterized protein n=1 Tax=Cytobacillus purgationiresistens TaxID=863449 RepID=A0ABU0AKR5_9BACI|nr:hypothetical protein [Cytobacillus purgationiresistens]MDQ0271855.1 hypothetical protein [Cytobacillus purgationiresistens]
MKQSTFFIGLLLFITALGFGYYHLNGMKTEGYTIIEENHLLEEEGQFYIVLDGRKVKVTKDQSESVVLGEWHHFKFGWNTLLNHSGKLEELYLDIDK